jgi:hypothetical protein
MGGDIIGKPWWRKEKEKNKYLFLCVCLVSTYLCETERPGELKHIILPEEKETKLIALVTASEAAFRKMISRDHP